MITGVVKGDEAVIQVLVHGRRGQTRVIDAIVDTGFTAWLTLPTAVVIGLGLRWHSHGRGSLADDSEVLFDIYQASVVWNGRRRRIRVFVFDAAPLVGMSLLRGCELKMQVRSRGEVTITGLPGWRQTRDN